jgi:hypothetical protein
MTKRTDKQIDKVLEEIVIPKSSGIGKDTLNTLLQLRYGDNKNHLSCAIK